MVLLLRILIAALGCRAALSQSLTVDIKDGTAQFLPSTESTYDHMVNLDDSLSFHWNDIMLGNNQFMGRLIHISDSMDQAPSWLGFGVYHSNHNYTVLPVSNFMVGSTALIGMPSMAEAQTPAQHYHLGAKMVDGITQQNDDTTFTNANVVQHDSDDGSVVTDLTFTKSLDAPAGNPQGSLRRQGVNVFLWAFGSPGGSQGRLGKHAQKGVLFLDFQAVQNQIEGETTTEGGGGGLPQDDGSAAAESTLVNTSPVIRGQCGSDLIDGKDAGHVALTPTLAFHWKLLKSDKIEIALQYTGQEAWLGVAASKNGYMIGSSAVIGSPGNDNLAKPPQHFSLNDKDITAVIPDGDVILEDASIVSTPASDDPSKSNTTLHFTKAVNDPNDPVPITSGLTTFLYAVGVSRELAYHEHRGAFRINLEECGGKITTANGSVWSSHGTFAAHGFFATLAWGLATPFAVTIAWFRTLVPASWIYVHVFANVFSFLATLIAFFIVVAGISKQDGADHFSKAHHWVGLFLFLLATFQVLNGFLRPPVQRKDARVVAQPPDTFLGIIPIPRTPRETWVLMHRLSGLAGIAMGIYQIQSGLGLYADRFQTNSMVKYYWLYVILFFLSLIGLKFWVIYEEDKARQGVMQAVSTSDPVVEQELAAATVVEMS